MAKIKWSAIGITNASGKSGGSVFAHNRGGSYVRRWAKPVNAQTPAQTIMRSIFSAVTKAWGKLSESEVQAWNQYGKDNPKADVFGDSRPQTGFNAFVGVNQNRLHSGYPTILQLPIAKVVPPAVIAQTLSLEYDGTDNIGELNLNLDKEVAAGDNIMLSIGFAIVNAEQNRGYGSVKNKFGQRIRVPLITSGTTFTLDSSLDPSFSDVLKEMLPGDKLFIQMHIHTPDGTKGNEITNSAVLV